MLAAFLPLLFFLFVVAGWLPLGAILIIALRNISNVPPLLFSGIYLAIYSAVLYWLSDVVATLVVEHSGRHLRFGISVVVLVFAGIGLLPIYGVPHNEPQLRNAYQLYWSGTLS